MGIPICYSPNMPTSEKILVAKPHGSLNMVMNNAHFKFGQPGWLGLPQTPGFSSYSGILPPRLNKEYSQHPIAKIILAPLKKRKPDSIIMWGVGLTESDVDLVSLYKQWAESADTIDVINPSKKVANKVENLCNSPVSHFSSLADWTQLQEGNRDT